MNAFQHGFFDELAKLAADFPGRRIDPAYEKTPLGKARRAQEQSETVKGISARQKAHEEKLRQADTDSWRAQHPRPDAPLFPHADPSLM